MISMFNLIRNWQTFLKCPNHFASPPCSEPLNDSIQSSNLFPKSWAQLPRILQSGPTCRSSHTQHITCVLTWSSSCSACVPSPLNQVPPLLWDFSHPPSSEKRRGLSSWNTEYTETVKERQSTSSFSHLCLKKCDHKKMFPVGLHCYLVFIQSSKKTGLTDFYVKQSTVSILKKKRKKSTVPHWQHFSIH